MATFQVVGTVRSETHDGWDSSIGLPTLMVEAYSGAEAIKKVAQAVFAIADPTRKSVRLVADAWCPKDERAAFTNHTVFKD